MEEKLEPREFIFMKKTLQYSYAIKNQNTRMPVWASVREKEKEMIAFLSIFIIKATLLIHLGIYIYI